MGDKEQLDYQTNQLDYIVQLVVNRELELELGNNAVQTNELAVPEYI